MNQPAETYAYDVRRPQLETAKTGNTPGISRAPVARKRKLPWVLFSLAFAGLALTALVLWFFVILPIGFGTSMVAAIAALVPFGIVVAAIMWLDRYTPQPKFTLLYAFMWGAVGSIALTFVFGTALLIVIAFQTRDATAQQFLAVAFQAPLVEEATKACGLVLLLLFGRRYISGPIDGVIYAMLIAAGFAFTENITYFGRAFAEAQVVGNSSVFWETFLLRGLMSPFAHATFTSLVGLGLGIAAERRSLLLYFSLGLGGMGSGMMLHALWNGLSMWIAIKQFKGLFGSFYFYYAVIWIPIFTVLAVILVALRLRERFVAKKRLSEYAKAGWFTQQEVVMLVGLRSRRRSLHWAARRGAVARMAMADFHRAALRLVAHRQAALSGHSSARIRGTEAQLLDELTRSRRLVNSLTLPVAPSGV